MSQELTPVFQDLRKLMEPYMSRLVVVTDSAETLYLDTAHVMKNKQPLFFGAVKVQKHYVSYYLMPVYVWPELLDGLSPALRKRMQGKSCFNFTTPDAALLVELGELTRAGYARYAAEGYVQAPV